jgi:hypothetical protein
MKFRKKAGIYKEAVKQVWKEMPLRQKAEAIGTFGLAPFAPPLAILSGGAYLTEQYWDEFKRRLKAEKEVKELKKKLGEVV